MATKEDAARLEVATKEVATKEEIARLEVSTNGSIAGIRADMAELRGEVRGMR